MSAAEGTTLLHGDINQSNLLIDSAGQVVLIDWARNSRRPAPPGVPHLRAHQAHAAKAAATWVAHRTNWL